jgi:hypothetical protein
VDLRHRIYGLDLRPLFDLLSPDLLSPTARVRPEAARPASAPSPLQRYTQLLHTLLHLSVSSLQLASLPTAPKPPLPGPPGLRALLAVHERPHALPCWLRLWGVSHCAWVVTKGAARCRVPLVATAGLHLSATIQLGRDKGGRALHAFVARATAANDAPACYCNVHTQSHSHSHTHTHSCVRMLWSTRREEGRSTLLRG